MMRGPSLNISSVLLLISKTRWLFLFRSDKSNDLIDSEVLHFYHRWLCLFALSFFLDLPAYKYIFSFCYRLIVYIFKCLTHLTVRLPVILPWMLVTTYWQFLFALSFFLDLPAFINICLLVTDLQWTFPFLDVTHIC